MLLQYYLVGAGPGIAAFVTCFPADQRGTEAAVKGKPWIFGKAYQLFQGVQLEDTTYQR